MSVQFMQYTRGCSVRWDISVSTPGVFSTVGDIMMSVEGYHKYSESVQYTGEYHGKCGGIS